MLKSAICKGIRDSLHVESDFVRNQSIFEFYNQMKQYSEDRELELRRCLGLLASASGLVDRAVVSIPRSWLAGAFSDGVDFSGKRDRILVEFGHFADGWCVFALCEWIRDGFGGCSRGDCGWMVA